MRNLIQQTERTGQYVDNEMAISNQYLTQLLLEMVDQKLGSITISSITY